MAHPRSTLSTMYIYHMTLNRLLPKKCHDYYVCLLLIISPNLSSRRLEHSVGIAVAPCCHTFMHVFIKFPQLLGEVVWLIVW